jgi:hypothetical protein
MFLICRSSGNRLSAGEILFGKVDLKKSVFSDTCRLSEMGSARQGVHKKESHFTALRSAVFTDVYRRSASRFLWYGRQSVAEGRSVFKRMESGSFLSA